MSILSSCTHYCVIYLYLYSKDEDSESVIRHHEQMQEEIAEDMVSMAKSMKNNSLVAKKIIQSDNEVSTQSFI